MEIIQLYKAELMNLYKQSFNLSLPDLIRKSMTPGCFKLKWNNSCSLDRTLAAPIISPARKK